MTTANATTPTALTVTTGTPPPGVFAMPDLVNDAELADLRARFTALAYAISASNFYVPNNLRALQKDRIAAAEANPTAENLAAVREYSGRDPEDFRGLSRMWRRAAAKLLETSVVPAFTAVFDRYKQRLETELAEQRARESEWLVAFSTTWQPWARFYGTRIEVPTAILESINARINGVIGVESKLRLYCTSNDRRCPALAEWIAAAGLPIDLSGIEVRTLSSTPDEFELEF